MPRATRVTPGVGDSKFSNVIPVSGVGLELVRATFAACVASGIIVGVGSGVAVAGGIGVLVGTLVWVGIAVGGSGVLVGNGVAVAGAGTDAETGPNCCVAPLLSTLTSL